MLLYTFFALPRSICKAGGNGGYKPFISLNPPGTILADQLDGKIRLNIGSLFLQRFIQRGKYTCLNQFFPDLLDLGGIPCGMVSGNAVDSNGQTARHSWNIAQLGGGYTLIDATWNDQDHMGVNTHWYYGLSTAQMGADHFPDRDQVIPTCGDQVNWHNVRGYVVNTQADADAVIRRLIDGEVVNVRIASRQLYQQLAVNTYDYITDYNNRNPRNSFYGSYFVTKSDAQQCLMIYRSAD